MHLGKWLRQLRKTRGHSAHEVVGALGIPRPTLYLWEGENSRPDPVALGRLLDFYDASDAERLMAFELRALPPAA